MHRARNSPPRGTARTHAEAQGGALATTAGQARVRADPEHDGVCGSRRAAGAMPDPGRVRAAASRGWTRRRPRLCVRAVGAPAGRRGRRTGADGGHIHRGGAGPAHGVGRAPEQGGRRPHRQRTGCVADPGGGADERGSRGRRRGRWCAWGAPPAAALLLATALTWLVGAVTAVGEHDGSATSGGEERQGGGLDPDARGAG